MMKCPECLRITKPKEPTANMEYKEINERGHLQIIGQKRMCTECYDNEKIMR